MKGYQKVFIFALALLTRAFLAYIFYGSIDVSSFIGINRHTLYGTLIAQPFSIWCCAFPIITFYLWFAGFLAMVTSLPVAFCFKVIPIFFDALLACLLYDFARQCLRPSIALFVGLLYACSPIALLVVSIHGQWDSLPIFFLLLGLYIRQFCQNRPRSYFLFGMFFAFSFLMKPMALVLAPFFFTPYQGLKAELGKLWYVMMVVISLVMTTLCAAFFMAKAYSHEWFILFAKTGSFIHAHTVLLCTFGVIVTAILGSLIPWKSFSSAFRLYLWNQFAGILGCLFMTTFCFAALTWYGYDMFVVTDKILRYFNQGITVFGLPFAYPFNQVPWILVLKNRFWIMGLIGVVAYFYYKGKVSIFDALSICFALIFSFAGLNPQYLLWLVPLLMLTGRFGLFALFSLCATSFMVLFYAHPLGNPVVPMQNMMSFSALCGWSWFMPPVWFANQWLASLTHVLGNYGVPLVCMGIIGAIVTGIMSTKPIDCSAQPRVNVPVWYIFSPVVLSMVIGVCMALFARPNLATAFDRIIEHDWSYYDHVVASGMRVAKYSRGSWCNIVVLFILLIVLSSGASCWLMRVVNGEGKL